MAFLPAGTSGCETGILTMYSKRNTIVNKGWFIISFSSNRPLSFKVTPPGTKNSEKIQIWDKTLKFTYQNDKDVSLQSLQRLFWCYSNGKPNERFLDNEWRGHPKSSTSFTIQVIECFKVKKVPISNPWEAIRLLVKLAKPWPLLKYYKKKL